MKTKRPTKKYRITLTDGSKELGVNSSIIIDALDLRQARRLFMKMFNFKTQLIKDDPKDYKGQMLMFG